MISLVWRNNVSFVNNPSTASYSMRFLGEEGADPINAIGNKKKAASHFFQNYCQTILLI